jgi:hypothetical protein
MQTAYGSAEDLYECALAIFFLFARLNFGRFQYAFIINAEVHRAQPAQAETDSCYIILYFN